VADFIEPLVSELGLEPDRFQAFPAPREMLWLGGHQAQERQLLDAYRSEKLSHAWLFTGPEGVGKATMAYRFARFLLAHGDVNSPDVRNAQSLFVSENNEVAAQVARLSHSDLGVIARAVSDDGKKLKKEIGVDVIRDRLSLFKNTSGAGGWRIIIVDAADELNRASANALLKMLEEPPSRALFILIAHIPGALLPTIRSRCRALRFHPLSNDIVEEGLAKITDAQPMMLKEAAKESGGSMRAALSMLDPETASFRRDARKILDQLNGNNSKSIRQLIEKTTGVAGQKNFSILLEMMSSQLHQGLKGGAQNGSQLAARSELWEKLRRAAHDVEIYNLDRRPFLLSLFSEIADIERQATR
jgi:DNA polymerase III subunit delta'